jgi:hypothetical protein
MAGSDANNAKSVGYTVDPPELNITSFNVTVSGSQATFEAEICNQGTTAVTKFFTGFWNDKSGTPSCGEQFDGGSIFWNALTGIAMSAGLCKTISHSVSLPPGTYTAQVMADTECKIPEADESNNIQTAIYTIDPPDGGTITPDAAVDFPSTITKDQGIDYPSTITKDKGVDTGAEDSMPPWLDGGPCNNNGTCDPGEDCPCVDCCVCVPQPSETHTAKFTTEEEVQVECPVVGGDSGFKFQAEASVSTTSAPCPQCKTSTQTMGKLAAEFGLCKQLKFLLEGSNAYTYTSQQCLGCDPDTCEKKCLESYCSSESFNGSVSIGISRLLGWQMKKKMGKLGSLVAKCGATVGGKLTIGGGYEKTEDGGCKPCQQCLTKKANLGLGVFGDAGCGAKLRIGKWPFKFGCQNCAKLNVDVAGGGDFQSGACGSQDCAWIKVGATGELNTGSRCVGVWWFKVGFMCKGSVKGEKTFNSCQSVPGSFDADFGCEVEVGLSACQ